MYDTTLSQKYVKDMGLCKRKIKDAYPKKVCHMPTRHVKKQDSPYPKKKKEKNRKRNKRDGSYKAVHIPSSKNIHTLTHLDQGL